jgi:hypothetical protein
MALQLGTYNLLRQPLAHRSPQRPSRIVRIRSTDGDRARTRSQRSIMSRYVVGRAGGIVGLGVVGRRGGHTG